MKISTLVNDSRVWLFNDSVKDVMPAVFVDAKEILAKDEKTKIPVAILRTELSDQTFVSLWKTDTKKMVKVYGDDTDRWKDATCQIILRKDKLFIEPVEQKL